MSGDGLSRAVELLGRQVGHWEPARWAARAGDGDASPAEVMHRLVQRIADLAADAEGQPRRAVPRLDNDLALPDQLRVVVADLIAADPPAEVLDSAAAEVTATRGIR